MTNTDDIDRFGHCVVCHKNLLTKKVVDGKVVDMFLPIYNHTFFLLDNGSQMQVTICTPCKDSVNLNEPSVHESIMSAVMKGWELETKLKQDEGDEQWNKERRDIYLENMGRLSIDCHCEDLAPYVIQSRQLELKNAKVEELEEEVKK